MHTRSAPPLLTSHPPCSPSIHLPILPLHLSLQPAPQGPQPSTTCVTPWQLKIAPPPSRDPFFGKPFSIPHVQFPECTHRVLNTRHPPPRSRAHPRRDTCRQLLSSRKARTTHNTLTIHGVLSGSKRCRFNNAGDVIPPSRFPFVNPQKRPRQAGGPSKRVNFQISKVGN